MLIDLLMIAAGLVVLYYGGDFLITGAVRIARQFKISPFVIGATVIGFGTSAPELAVSVLASFQGSPELALGNVIGSNIANVGLVLGLTALVSPLCIAEKRLRDESIPLLGATFLILGLAWNLQLSRVNGAVLILLLAAYIWRNLSKKEDSIFEVEEDERLFPEGGMGIQVLLIVVGLIMLVLGAHWLVKGAASIARSFGISEWFIGISIVAVGTSLPEIVSSIIAAKRGHAEMAIGNVFGSNIFNILMVLGVAASIKPLHIQEPIHPDLVVTTVLTCLLIILIRLEHQLSKRDGAILLICYFSYIGMKAGGIF